MYFYQYHFELKYYQSIRPLFDHKKNELFLVRVIALWCLKRGYLEPRHINSLRFLTFSLFYSNF